MTPQLTETRSQVGGNGKDASKPAVDKFVFEECGLEVKEGATLTVEEWKDGGKRLRPKAGWPWLVGDWLRIGEDKKFIDSEKYDLAEETLDLDRQTLKNYVYVAKRVERTVRRYDLGWAHHQAVARFSSDDQEKWLEDAAKNQWPLRKLRVKIKESLGGDGGGSSSPMNVKDAEVTVGDLREQMPELDEYLTDPDENMLTRISSCKPPKPGKNK